MFEIIAEIKYSFRPYLLKKIEGANTPASVAILILTVDELIHFNKNNSYLEMTYAPIGILKRKFPPKIMR